MMQIKTKFATKSEFYTILCLSVCVCAKQSIVYWWLIFYTLIKLILESFAGSVLYMNLFEAIILWYLGPRMTLKLSQELPTPTLDITTEAFIIQNWFGCNSWYSFFKVFVELVLLRSLEIVSFLITTKLYTFLKDRRTVCTVSFYTAMRNLSNCLTTQLGRESEGCVAECWQVELWKDVYIEQKLHIMRIRMLIENFIWERKHESNRTRSFYLFDFDFFSFLLYFVFAGRDRLAFLRHFDTGRKYTKGLPPFK